MPRTLVSALRAFFTSISRVRGDSYFSSGSVSQARTEPGLFSAKVRGTNTYDVLLSLEGTRLSVSCTCPYFIGVAEPCKHIWAVVRAADQAHAFEVPADVWLDIDLESALDDTGDFATPDQRSHAPFSQSIRSLPRVPGVGERGAAAADGTTPAWKAFLTQASAPPAPTPAHLLPRGELLYVLDVEGSAASGEFLVEVLARERRKSGDWGKPKPVSFDRGLIPRLSDVRDRAILEAVVGAQPSHSYFARSWSGYHTGAPVPQAVALSLTLQRDLGPRLCETERLFARVRFGAGSDRESAYVPVVWDAEPASFHVRIAGDAGAGYTIAGVMRRNGLEYGVDDVLLVTSGSVVWKPETLAGPARLSAFDAGRASQWLAGLMREGTIAVPGTEAGALVEALAQSDLADIDSPDELRFEVQSVVPRPTLRIGRRSAGARIGYAAPPDRLEATLRFTYGTCEVEAWSETAAAFDRERRTAYRRDHAFEREAIARLQSIGLRLLADWQTGTTRLDLADSMLPAIVSRLALEGWRVEADGRVYRASSAVTLEVHSGIDWFELRGGVEFDGLHAALPAILAAARRGDSFVQLGDGTIGVLPADWLARNARILATGELEPDHVRFLPSQAALLDAWLAAQPSVSCDETFARIRTALARFERVDPVEPPPTFRGVLRPYQRDALAWFEFLRQFGFGGCLADEMGLGKTVMVLAALEARRLERDRERSAPHPSLVVVPRSLVFNWRQEAGRFAPKLRVLDYTGGGRRDLLDSIAAHDIVLTTYGTLRRDVAHLKEIAFDYVILDEAQAIKNATTSAAKSARLLKAQHRLALSGTPVENHLGELWSLFEFLNPGVLGSAALFSTTGGASRAVDDESLSLLARGLRPFILRRTKDLVASELPARTEQTLYCDLEPPQREVYDELRNHYRAALLGRVERDGLGRSKMQILEALLRLRQAACHPALINKAHAGDPCAKFDVLVPRLQELVEDGRQVIVFSQFTTLLGLLRTRLDAASLAYEYLDGRTRNREARVTRFQNGDVPLFLVSLKAGGLGLNLTAAEHVFLLDPWWNPAVEAQAIDRAHRIGQTRPVFAFRLIARDTVEEKVLQLQAGKRRLADAIVRADEGLIRDLRRDDLELLLS
jgi:superfamily II DNA or RNA helicase